MILDWFDIENSPISIEEIENCIYFSEYYYNNSIFGMIEIEFDKLKTNGEDTQYVFVYKVDLKKLIVYIVERDIDGEENWDIESKVSIEEFSEKTQKYLNTIIAIAKI